MVAERPLVVCVLGFGHLGAATASSLAGVGIASSATTGTVWKLFVRVGVGSRIRTSPSDSKLAPGAGRCRFATDTSGGRTRPSPPDLGEISHPPEDVLWSREPAHLHGSIHGDIRACALLGGMASARSSRERVGAVRRPAGYGGRTGRRGSPATTGPIG